MTTVAERLEALARRFGLSPQAPGELAAILELLADPAAPTSVKEPDRAVDAHVADSLVAFELEAVREATSIADLGAGAGFPGLALAVALPGARVHLVESAARKCAFLERAVAAAGLTNVEVVHDRAEEWDDGACACDLVTARALAELAVVAEYAAPLLLQGGAVVAWKGRRNGDEEARGARAAAELGLEPVEVRRVDPYPGAGERHLHVMRKVAATPDRFPRRPGMARKRPLGANSPPGSDRDRG